MTVILFVIVLFHFAITFELQDTKLNDSHNFHILNVTKLDHFP